jgi:hypothetical protein
MEKRKALFCLCLLLSFCLLLSYLVAAKTKIISPVEKLPVRTPAVAVSFYPAEPKALRARINQLLEPAPAVEKKGKLQILIVPHAGLEYSGSVAAAGFKQLEGQTIGTIILLGASHRAFFEGVAVFNQGAWETPLGKVSIDEELAEKLVSPDKGIFGNPLSHQEEHSLEVELPFLQIVLPKAQIVPILIGQAEETALAHLAQRISQNLDELTLLLISSDLSHYPPYEIAQKVDKKTIQAIVSGKAENLLQSLAQIESEHYPGLDTCACGYQAILVALQVTEKLKNIEFEEIKYANSGEVTGEKNQVVGYAAIAGRRQNGLSLLDESAQEEALALARQTLEAHLSGRPLSHSSLQSPLLSQPFGAFVTLKRERELRGCIGEFEPKEPLWEVIQKMAIAAATEDPRFPKVTAEELPDIKIEITVMTPRKKIDNWEKIRLGVDGVVVQYGNQAGTFLPQVATETGWSLEEFLSQLCSQKAGLPPHCYKNPAVNLYTFGVQILEER